MVMPALQGCCFLAVGPPQGSGQLHCWEAAVLAEAVGWHLSSAPVMQTGQEGSLTTQEGARGCQAADRHLNSAPVILAEQEGWLTMQLQLALWPLPGLLACLVLQAPQLQPVQAEEMGQQPDVQG
jgi:hypothetical protein